MNRISSTCFQTALNATRSGTFVCMDFTGKVKDSESGHHYFGARYYDSEALTGWLSVDPLSDDYPYISAYNYCEQNPVKLVDPDGENPVVGAIVGAAVDFGAQVVSSIVEGKSLKQSLGDVNWTSVGIFAAEGAITSGGSAVKQVVQTTAKHTIVKAASKTAAKKAAATATSTKGVSVVATTGRAVSKTANGDGSFVENLVAEAVGYGAAKGVTKAVNKAIKPKLTTNDAALANKGKGEKGSTVIRNNRSTNQTNLDKSNRNRSIATNVGTTATSWGTAAAQSAVKKDPNCNK